MRDTGIIRRIRLEADGEDIVGVIAGNVQIIGAGFVVLQLQCGEFQLWNVLCSDDSETVELGARLRIQREIRHGLSSRICCVSQHGEVCKWERVRMNENLLMMHRNKKCDVNGSSSCAMPLQLSHANKPTAAKNQMLMMMMFSVLSDLARTLSKFSKARHHERLVTSPKSFRPLGC